MATSEENKELIETIKRPIRHYRILLWGYGGENSYIRLTKEQYEYWNQRKEDDDERDILVDYMLDEDREEVADVPPAMEFMSDPEDLEGPRYPWHESPNEIVHQFGVDYSNARITITEIESDEYSSKPIEDIVDGVDLNDFVSEHDIEWFSDEVEETQSDYMLQFNSSEKGTFFEGILTTVGKIDLSKLEVYTTDHFNDDDTVDDIRYDGESIENMGGDTNGKGYSVYMWSNKG
jgi:hypothetical protein